MKRFQFLLVALLLASGWLADALVGPRVAQWLAARCGAALLRMGQGKFTDAALFIQHRLHEAIWLTTLVAVWLAAHWLLGEVMNHRCKNFRSRWAVQGIAGFVGLNVWLAAAMNTGLFWGALGAGGNMHVLMQFHFKRLMMEENPTPHRAVLVGSSQTRAEINEDQLNDLIGTNLWTTELHFPGSHGYDVFLIERQIRRANPQLVICYLSEGYFYSDSGGPMLPNFFSLRDLPDAWHRGALHYLSGAEIGSGLLGDLLPVYRLREIFAQRLFGATATQLKQQQYNTALTVDLDTRAQVMAASFRISPESDFQKTAFADFVGRCQQAHRRVLLLVGGYNPLLEQRINPAVHADMLHYLDQLKARYSAVTLISPTELPEQTPADYDDLNHVNADMQSRYTAGLARLLAHLPTNAQSTP
jgi:hypothetical protein